MILGIHERSLNGPLELSKKEIPTLNMGFLFLKEIFIELRSYENRKTKNKILKENNHPKKDNKGNRFIA